MSLDFKAAFAAGQAANVDNSVVNIKQRSTVAKDNNFEDKLNSIRKESENSSERSSDKDKIARRDSKEDDRRAADRADNSGRVKDNDDVRKDIKQEKDVDKDKIKGEKTDTAASAKEKAPVEGTRDEKTCELTDGQKAALLKDIADIAGVTPEQAQSILENMGIAPDDLINQDNLNKFVMEAKGLEEPVELLTLSNFADMSKDIKNAVNAAFEEAGVMNQGTVAEGQENFFSVLKDSGKARKAAKNENAQAQAEIVQTPVAAVTDSAGVTGVTGAAGNADSTFNEHQNSGGEGAKPSDLTAEASATPTIVQKGSETVVEVAGKTVSRAPLSSQREEALDVINQIADKMKINFGAKSTEIRINLRPDELGNVTVKIATESGHVTGEIITESAKIKELVEQNLTVLRDALKEQGVDVGELSVSVGQQETDEKMKQFMYEQEKSKSRLDRIMQKIDSEEELALEQVNFVDEGTVTGSTVNFSA